MLHQCRFFETQCNGSSSSKASCSSRSRSGGGSSSSKASCSSSRRSGGGSSSSKASCSSCCRCATVAKVFEGNADSDTVKHSYIEQPITARFLRFQTVHWNNQPCMRVEIVGCQRTNIRSIDSSLSSHPGAPTPYRLNDGANAPWEK